MDGEGEEEKKHCGREGQWLVAVWIEVVEAVAMTRSRQRVSCVCEMWMWETVVGVVGEAFVSTLVVVDCGV